MVEFIGFSEGVEVNGQTVMSIVDGMGVFKETAYRILKDNGIDDPEPGMWYSQQSWLDAFKTISENVGENTLYQVGKKIPANADWPPGIKTIHEALDSVNKAYHMNHRGGEIGYYRYEKTGENSGKMICCNPYPCDFDRGIIEAVAVKFRPAGSFIRVEHTDNEKCRKKGQEICVYNVSWKTLL
ncbi:MAG: hypothetical protein ABIH89_08155 [Elusimicrobiota bacterium]